MSFKEKAIRGHTTKSGNVGTAVSTGVQLATVIGGAIAGAAGAGVTQGANEAMLTGAMHGGISPGQAALQSIAGGTSNKLLGAISGATRLSTIKLPGAQIALSTIQQAQLAKDNTRGVQQTLSQQLMGVKKKKLGTQAPPSYFIQGIGDVAIDSDLGKQITEQLDKEKKDE